MRKGNSSYRKRGLKDIERCVGRKQRGVKLFSTSIENKRGGKTSFFTDCWLSYPLSDLHKRNIPLHISHGSIKFSLINFNSRRRKSVVDMFRVVIISISLIVYRSISSFEVDDSSSKQSLTSMIMSTIRNKVLRQSTVENMSTWILH